jgi:YD repeat-containing protein
MERESGAIDAGNCRLQSEHDFHMWFSYLHGGTSDGQIRIREYSGGHLRMTVTSSSLVLRTNATTLDTETVATDTGVWYEYYAKADGANAEVWRRKKGTTDAMVKVLETTSSAVTTAGYFTFASGTGNYLDDVVVLKLDGDTVETETQAYNAANEMTSHTLDGATTSFAYDQFGRMTQKTRTGGYTGTYYYNYGDKLTKVASNFQGEGTVTYTYSGDQKRRSRSVSGGAMTKYRVDKGWGVVNEENSGGTLLSTYIHHPGRQIGTVLATSEGSIASSGTWNYYFQDAIGSTRSLWDEDGDRLGKYDYTPSAGNTATPARRLPGSSPATTGTTKPGCITPPTGSIVPTQAAG